MASTSVSPGNSLSKFSLLSHSRCPSLSVKASAAINSHPSLSAHASSAINSPWLTTVKPIKYNWHIIEPKSQGASQAVLYGVGLSEDDLSKPQVGVSPVWYEGNTCNMHLLRLSEAVKEGVAAAGMVPFRFNTVGVSDAISMGTRGMCYSLQSRDLIADSIETVTAAQWYNGNISIPGCDKNMPGVAVGRLSRSSTMIYGGGTTKCYREYVSGSISDDHRQNFICKFCPGAGAGVGMYASPTIASRMEALHCSLSTSAEDPLKLDECRLAGKYPDDFQKVSHEVPFLENLKTSGKYVMEDVYKIGRTPAVFRYLLMQGLVCDCITVTGKTLAELAPPLSKGQKIIRPVEYPINKTARIQILYANLAPQGSVAKIAGKEGLYFSGPALVFEGEEAMIASISDDPSTFKGKVVVIRGEGPKCGPGMPEMLTPKSVIMGSGLGKEVVLLTDGRFSGDSQGFVVGHICHEAQEGDPIALIQNGDRINIAIGIHNRRIGALVSDEEMEACRKKWTLPPYKSNQGGLYKYIKNVNPSSSGCVTNE